MPSPAEDLHAIPGTIVFDAARCRAGYHLNMFCIALVDPAGRAAFKSDEEAFLQRFPMTQEQRAAVRARDYNRMLELGGNIYYLGKIAAVDGLSFINLTCRMADMSESEFRDMMLAGGRRHDGSVPAEARHG